jgi:hypothetical protein
VIVARPEPSEQARQHLCLDHVVPNSIEREVLIDAPVQLVRSIVTEPAHVGRWLGDAAQIDRRPGGDGNVWTLVELHLRADGEGTRLRVVESGLARLAYVSTERLSAPS